MQYDEKKLDLAIHMNDLYDTGLSVPDVCRKELREAVQAAVGNKLVEVGQGTAWTFPWLHEDDCKALVEAFSPEEYAPNLEEVPEARIDEIVLAEHDEDLEDQLIDLFSSELTGIITALTGLQVEGFSSIQMALYRPDGVKQGTWHTDADSDVTVTVALNDNYVGGGFQILGHNGEIYTLPKAQAGQATLFLGRTHLHRGLPVADGSRYLLVFWCKV